MIIVQDLHNALCTASELGDYFSANELEDHIVQGTWKIIIFFFLPNNNSARFALCTASEFWMMII